MSAWPSTCERMKQSHSWQCQTRTLQCDDLCSVEQCCEYQRQVATATADNTTKNMFTHCNVLQHHIPHHLFTACGKPSRVNQVDAKLKVCVSAVGNWCAAKRLQLSNKSRQTFIGWKYFQVERDNVSPSTLSVTSASSSTMNWRWSHTSVELQVHASANSDDCMQCGASLDRFSSLGIHPAMPSWRPSGINTCTAAVVYACRCPSRLWP